MTWIILDLGTQYFDIWDTFCVRLFCGVLRALNFMHNTERVFYGVPCQPAIWRLTLTIKVEAVYSPERSVHTIISVCLERSKIENSTCSRTHPEEVLCGTWVQCAILDLSLFGKVISRFNGSQHTLHSQEGSQVSSVRWDDDQSEEPPYTSNYSTWHRPIFKKSSFFLRLLMENRESLFYADMTSSNF